MEERIFKSRKYSNAFCLVLFMLLYLIMLFSQNDVLTAYEIESSAQNQISIALPPSFFLENPVRSRDCLPLQRSRVGVPSALRRRKYSALHPGDRLCWQ